MRICFYLLFFFLHVNAGCRLKGNKDIQITAYTGDSVLLPCSCTDLHTKPQIFTWSKYDKKDKWIKISPESDQYTNKFQLVNESSGYSLFISHVTGNDDGYYMCMNEVGEIRYIRLIVEGCKLTEKLVYVTGYVGQSVLLPCSCSDLQAKPHTFTWLFYKDFQYKEIYPKDQTNLYTGRVQLINDHPGNLSLLISQLTLKDEGYYRCEIRKIITDVPLVVKDAPIWPLTSTPIITTTNSTSESLPFIPFAVVTAIFLHIIVAVVYCSTRKKGLKNSLLQQR
ncbi:uncharacterized protein LOC124401441 isoform X2 [Silurus meridionalis]|uniref:Ig-like domain-containing protein n=1 Tax=Silurus meridionalis TaxID=175797 RepID=A0A8T0AQV7_SILME|nr:uncharacterized protein LOC124401441 isoform X2 [Silurus meridionalis]KAF7694453.1 hypothetical protein HF521_008206 [Silurus meridionalis]